MDIYNTIIDEKLVHHHFASTRDDAYKKKVLNSWADEAFANRDGTSKFIKEFQTTFNSSLWELYCYQVLKEMGCHFDFSVEYPDFKVDLNGESLLVECTIANNPSDDPKESDIEARFNDNSDLDYKVYHQTLRLSNSMINKSEKYINQYIKDADNIGKPYIIAVEPFDQPYFMLTGNESIISLLYGEVYDRYNKASVLADGAIKKNGAPISLGIFLNEEYKHVSGVLFSNVATIGKVDAIGDDPNLTFAQLRYDLTHKKPILAIDSRIQENKYDPRCKAIKEIYKDFHDFYSMCYPRSPLINWGTNYKETLGDGLYYFVNPNAENPLNEKTIEYLYKYGINVMSYDLSNRTLIDDKVHDGSLIQRTVMNLKNKGHINY